MAKTYLITGTSSGFGWLMTERLLARGDRVVATVRDADALARLAGMYGDRLRVEVLDLTDTAAIRAVVNDTFALTIRASGLSPSAPSRWAPTVAHRARRSCDRFTSGDGNVADPGAISVRPWRIANKHAPS